MGRAQGELGSDSVTRCRPRLGKSTSTDQLLVTFMNSATVSVFWSSFYPGQMACVCNSFKGPCEQILLALFVASWLIAPLELHSETLLSLSALPLL